MLSFRRKILDNCESKFYFCLKEKPRERLFFFPVNRERLEVVTCKYDKDIKMYTTMPLYYLFNYIIITKHSN